MRHEISGRTRRHKASSLAAAALGEVMSDPSNLQRSVSHLNWGHYLGFDEAGHYAIETVEGRRLSFDATAGRLVAAD